MPTGPKPTAPSPAVLALYNAIPSVFWSVLGLVPLSIFCYQHLARPWLYGFLAASLAVYAVPRLWFRGWQLSARPAVYERLGVPLVNYFTQHGRLVNGLLRRRYPQYRHLRGRLALRALVEQSYHMERFHAAALVFFLLCALQAAAQERWDWAALLTVLNVGYNLYPIWLQQYLRVRLGHGQARWRDGTP